MKKLLILIFIIMNLDLSVTANESLKSSEIKNTESFISFSYNTNRSNLKIQKYGSGNYNSDPSHISKALLAVSIPLFLGGGAGAAGLFVLSIYSGGYFVQIPCIITGVVFAIASVIGIFMLISAIYGLIYYGKTYSNAAYKDKIDADKKSVSCIYVSFPMKV
jgi:hypothetical protein